MPTTASPPQLDPQHGLSEGKGGDHGAGRKPPVDKRTGGNGDGDNWDHRPVGSRGPRERLSQCRIGLASALAADALFFGGLLAAFMVTKSSYHVDAYSHYINSWLPTEIPTILWLNSAVLLLSSAAAEYARRSMFHEQDVMDEWIGLGRPTSRRATAWLVAALFLGTLFVAGQWIAWSQLRAQHVFYGSGQSAQFFYLLTVMHAAHLLLGMLGLLVALAALRSSRQFATRRIFVDTTVWYWHAMGLLWLVLFVLLEYGQ